VPAATNVDELVQTLEEELPGAASGEVKNADPPR
jgi:hypothetical protein